MVILAAGQPFFSDFLKAVQKKGLPDARYFAGSGRPFLALF